MRRIAFIGNCQLRSLASIYQTHAAKRQGEEAFYIRTEDTGGEVEKIAGAAIVVGQLTDLGDSLSEVASQLRDKAVFRVPHAAGAFLWPQAGDGHVAATGLFAPRFGTDYGDRYLNRAIRRNANPAETIREYATAEFGRVFQLDRRLELAIERQASRDHQLGYDVSGIIRRHFRDEYLFRSQGHPQLRIMRHLAETLFNAMRVCNDALDSLAANLIASNLPAEPDFAPIHPAVIAHFGLSFVSSDNRFPIWDELDTFRDYAYRYMGLGWNLPIEQGLAAGRRGNLAEAEQLLQQGLSRSPNSARAHAELAEILFKTERPAAAIAHWQEAIRLQQSISHYHHAAHHYHMVSRAAPALDNRELAIGAAARAVELDPASDFLMHSFSDLLVGVDRLREAIAMRERAASLAPHWPHHQYRLAELLHKVGDGERAEAAERRAQALEAALT